LMSGESGMATIQETIRRVSQTAGVDPCSLGRLIVTDRIPQLDDPVHLQALADFIAEHGIQVLLLDPIYLAMSGADAGNLFVQGKRLRAVAEVCRAHHVTPILCHHNRNTGKEDRFGLPELEDIAWAGFQEFARQWLLIGRREPYLPGSGQHRLWLVAGGSAGHGSAWALDVAEGNREDEGGRIWETELRPAGDEFAAAKDRHNQEKALAKRAVRENQVNEAWEFLRSQLPDGATQTAIAKAAKVNHDRVKEIIRGLLDSGSIIPCKVTVGNGQTRDGYQAVQESEEVVDERQENLF
jgi:hypothetical protein